MSRKNVLSLILPALAAALIAAFSQLSIPIGPVPITLQTFIVGLVATVLKAREALLASLLYLLLGAIGLPVFAGGSGGFQALLGPLAGFLWACPLFALITASLTKADSSLIRIFLANLLGDASLFLLGWLGLQLLGSLSPLQAFTLGVLPFLIGDFIKLVLITLTSKPILQALKNEPYFK